MIKREVNRGPIRECRCDERLKAKAEVSTRLTAIQDDQLRRTYTLGYYEAMVKSCLL